MKNKTTMTSYTSPKTGITYGIEAKTDLRVVDFVDGQPVWGETPYWNVMLDGRMVQFSLTEEGILDAVDRAEGHDDSIYSSRFD